VHTRERSSTLELLLPRNYLKLQDACTTQDVLHHHQKQICQLKKKQVAPSPQSPHPHAPCGPEHRQIPTPWTRVRRTLCAILRTEHALGLASYEECRLYAVITFGLVPNRKVETWNRGTITRLEKNCMTMGPGPFGATIGFAPRPSLECYDVFYLRAPPPSIHTCTQPVRIPVLVSPQRTGSIRSSQRLGSRSYMRCRMSWSAAQTCLQSDYMVSPVKARD
jgi:hypothetical protein